MSDASAPASVALRFAGPDDAETLYALIVELAVYEREPEVVEATPQTLREQLLLDHPPFECVIAEVGDHAVGMALFFHNYSTWTGKRGLYLEDLFVVPSHRGQGVGFALLRKLAQIAVDRDCGRFEWAVLDWNEPAIEFYDRLGARPLKEWLVHRLAGDALRRVARSSASRHTISDRA